MYLKKQDANKLTKALIESEPWFGQLFTHRIYLLQSEDFPSGVYTY